MNLEDRLKTILRKDIEDMSREELLAYVRDLGKRAHTDSLTGLPNREMFNNEFERNLALADRQGYSLALAYMDLDGFKQVNDTMGHSQGDEILRDVANMIRKNFRASDLSARVGGDEFTLLMPDMDERYEIREAMDRLDKRIGEYSVRKGLGIGLSAGVSLFPEHSKEGKELLEFADKAMYQAKKRGIPYMIFDPDNTKI